MTGSNRGIGLELVKQLAEKTPEDARIYAGCRTPDGSNAQVSSCVSLVRQWKHPHVQDGQRVGALSPNNHQLLPTPTPTQPALLCAELGFYLHCAPVS